MQNAVPAPAPAAAPPRGTATGVEASVAARTLRDRSAAYADEIRRLLDATYAVMRATGGLDPRVSDIVTEAGLSNQAFYRHFRGKDELLLAVLADGQERLVSYLEARMARVAPGPARVRAWIEGVLEQARNPDAAANTRPFTANSARLAARYPVESAASRARVIEPLRDAAADAGGDPRHDADAIAHLAMGRMGDAIARGDLPGRDEVEHLVQFCLRGAGVGVGSTTSRAAPDGRAPAGGT